MHITPHEKYFDSFIVLPQCGNSWRDIDTKRIVDEKIMIKFFFHLRPFLVH